MLASKTQNGTSSTMSQHDEHLIQFNVRIPIKQRIALDRYREHLRQKEGKFISFSTIVREALDDYLDSHDDTPMAKEA